MRWRSADEVDERGPRAVVAHVVHQFAEVRARVCGKLVTGMAQIVEVDAGQVDSGKSRQPNAPVEVAVPDASAPHNRAHPGASSVPLKVSEIIKLIEADGWYLVATRGSQRQYKHPDKPGRVTVAGKPSKELPPDTERSILRQAGITRRAQ